MKFSIVASLGLVLGGRLPLFPSREECLTEYIQDAMDQFPGYACAIFKPDQWTFHGSLYHEKILHCVNFLFERQCLVRGSPGAYIERKGDGGMMNWRYDPHAFRREGNRLWVLPN